MIKLPEIVLTEKPTQATDLKLPEFRDDGSIPQMNDYKWPARCDQVRTKIELLIGIWKNIEREDAIVGAFKRRLFGYRWLAQWIVTDKDAVDIIDVMLRSHPFPPVEKHKYSRLEQALRHAVLNLTPLVRSRSVLQGEKKTDENGMLLSARHNLSRKISAKLEMFNRVYELNHSAELLKTPLLIRQSSKSRPRKALSSPHSPVMATIPEMSTTTTVKKEEGDAGQQTSSFPPIHQITPTSSFSNVPDSSASA